MADEASDEIYLDIETDRWQRITVVGFRSQMTGLVQLVGAEITPIRLRDTLPAAGRLFTYNGHCFDLPVIRKQLGLDLRVRFASCDLRFVCQRYGLRGGQKAVEHQLGHRRALDGMDGWDAVVLWARHLRGDATALPRLLHYNAEDVDGLALIKRHLESRGLLPSGAPMETDRRSASSRV